ncbi:conserved hypothetical protein [Ricinus communis]|uniref:Uncharacterized protein n=1 Tax=Ricinus communis TaxID=3988 RepID=B9SJ82_RICCO|nr:conserved hypothetical protein [Ricinus communis]
MADKGVVLGSEIKNTIMTFLCHSSFGKDIVGLLPNFASEVSEKSSISCNKLLMKIRESSPEPEVHAASNWFAK